jgi:hypothetical protein
MFRLSDVYGNLFGDDVIIWTNLSRLSLAMEKFSLLLFLQFPHYNLRNKVYTTNK